MEYLMNKTNLNLTYGLCAIAIVAIVFAWYQNQNKKIVVTPVAVATSTQYTAVNNEEAVALSKINPNCGKYYEDLASGNNPIDKELTDFTNLYPLSDFLCGDYSMIQPKAKLPDGKILHFVAPVFLLDCGASGHCTYYPLLEEKPGLVRHIRGFTWYDDTEPTPDTDGTIFAWEISYDSSTNTLTVDDSHSCGTKNIYKFNAKDEPILISASDSCLQGNGTLYQLKQNSSL